MARDQVDTLGPCTMHWQQCVHLIGHTVANAWLQGLATSPAQWGPCTVGAIIAPKTRCVKWPVFTSVRGEQVKWPDLSKL